MSKVYEQVYGGSALPEFRLRVLLQSCQQEVPALQQLTALHLYHLAWRQPPRDAERTRLHELLDAAPAAAVAAAVPLWVLPRPGVRPPWSSKAADILAQCGLAAELRPGVEWRLLFAGQAPDAEQLARLAAHLHDRMTQMVVHTPVTTATLFATHPAPPLEQIPLQPDGAAALTAAGKSMGFALSSAECAALVAYFQQAGRDPTDAELMMYAQFHSEHCRHKIFNADWWLDGEPCTHTPFAWIRTTAAASSRLLSAYSDNAAVLKGYPTVELAVDAAGCYVQRHEPTHLVIKVETHNHPTAISPYPGAATGVGGEIRDEAATGQGARPGAGLTGFSVSDLQLPGFLQPWEQPRRHPPQLASPLQIMLEAPLGAADYNNEFGRPVLGGYFRTFEHRTADRCLGYDKPIMLAGGMGRIRAAHVLKPAPVVGDCIVLLGGPAMRIGVGGGSASSRDSRHGTTALDFSSVQRGNAEMQRRCQEVINRCRDLGSANPVHSIHDVGAGGLANAVPELLGELGAVLQLHDIPTDDPGMSPMEYWCNEAQERYLLLIAPTALEDFAQLCHRERAPCAVIGVLHASPRTLTLQAAAGQPTVVELPTTLLQQSAAPTVIHARRPPAPPGPTPATGAGCVGLDLDTLAQRVLRLPAVADKGFLLTIADRTVTARVHRDPLVGPWQVAVADCAVTGSLGGSRAGQAMAVGERTPIAALDAPASGRMAVAEALTNLCAARVLELQDVALSANWMAAAGQPGMDAELYATVQAVSTLCTALGIPIPVGKDSLSMAVQWQDDAGAHQVVSPLSLVVSAFARVIDTHDTLTPQLQAGETALILVDLGGGRDRLGASACARVAGVQGGPPPDLDHPADLAGLFRSVQLLHEAGYLLAYHDRSDGGLFVTLCEMAFAARQGLDITLPEDCDPVARLYSEEAGAVLQVPAAHVDTVLAQLRSTTGTRLAASVIGTPGAGRQLRIRQHGECIQTADLHTLQRYWAETGYRLRTLRDHPACAREEYDRLLDRDDPGLWVSAIPPIRPIAAAPAVSRPRLAVLREQGINGQEEMAAAFMRATFECVDVHTDDLVRGRVSLRDFQGLAACGGFSYGDVLGAGGGWAAVILHQARLREEFSAFFARPDTFSLGVCNGCQMLARIAALVPGAAHWPRFLPNRSQRFESRLVMVEVLPSPSILLAGMVGWQLPVVVAHGEGRVADSAPLACLRYIEADGTAAVRHPRNPNGSRAGLTAFTSTDGRATIMMPHPERCFLNVQLSWRPPGLQGELSPWMQLFHNARQWVEHGRA